MAEPYLTELRALADEWSRADDGVGELECRHFFSGAAAYRDGAIVATLTPVGLAFKVLATVRDDLLARGVASELSYFPNAPVKRDYVLFPAGTVVEPGEAARLLLSVG
jgi:hypothetical protein